ncbi:MAG: AbrB/MazE/SpoVT family DNA-binding domain-containing protein [Verrucomicrobia bacterium]|nr:MAG: AbrB/MazE/SpoVT family DNA-binding domain-containing protein [Verrucomicrobiota bacterium]
MFTEIAKWGNSLGLPLPWSICAESGLAEGSVVDLSMENGKLVVRAASDDALYLEDLLNGITEENIHEGFGTGNAKGGEAW